MSNEAYHPFRSQTYGLAGEKRRANVNKHCCKRQGSRTVLDDDIYHDFPSSTYNSVELSGLTAEIVFILYPNNTIRTI